CSVKTGANEQNTLATHGQRPSMRWRRSKLRLYRIERCIQGAFTCLPFKHHRSKALDSISVTFEQEAYVIVVAYRIPVSDKRVIWQSSARKCKRSKLT